MIFLKRSPAGTSFLLVCNLFAHDANLFAHGALFVHLCNFIHAIFYLLESIPIAFFCLANIATALETIQTVLGNIPTAL